MKSRIRAVSVLLALLLLFSGVYLPSAAAPTQGSTETHTEAPPTKKIVSVLYDNSGSMMPISGINEKNYYALYSMQMLMALLGENDTLIVTPMNGGKNFVVDLKKADRNSEIQRVIGDTLFTKPSGGTPSESVGEAMKQLTDNGLMDAGALAKADPYTEHWLVILSDGSFEDKSDPNYTADKVKEQIVDYPSLKTIFISFGDKAPDLSDTSLDDLPNVTLERAADAASIVETMQKVANQLSGRYTMVDDNGKNYVMNGSTVTIKLDQFQYAFKSISVIAQNTKATLKEVKYNGTAIKSPQMSICNIVPEEKFKMDPGWSSVIKGAPYLSGGEIVLTFSAPIETEKLSILVEPAIDIRAYLAYKDKTTGKWERTDDIQYINTNLGAGDTIRVGYEAYKSGSDELVDMKALFGDTKATVTYAGEQYDLGTNNYREISLKAGAYMACTSVSVMNGVYTMYSSFVCAVESVPGSYFVEVVDHTKGISFPDGSGSAKYKVHRFGGSLSGNDLKSGYELTVKAEGPKGTVKDLSYEIGSDGTVTVQVPPTDGIGPYRVLFKVADKETGIYRENNDVIMECTSGAFTIRGDSSTEYPRGDTQGTAEFSVLVEGEKLNGAQLSTYTVSAVGYKPNGEEQPATATVGSDGTIRCVTAFEKDVRGEYKIKLTVTSGAGAVEEYTHSMMIFPEKIEVVPSATNSLRLSQHQMIANERTLAFELFADGEPFMFDNTLTSYRIMVGNVDVTGSAVVFGNVLTYAPKEADFGRALPLGKQTVTVLIECDKVSSINTSASDSFEVCETQFVIEAVDYGDTEVDRFDLDGKDVALYFRVLRDDVPLTADELQEALDSGKLKIEDKKGTFSWQIWLPCGSETKVEQLGTEAVVAFRVTRDWIKPFHTFAAMLIFGGDSPVTASYGKISVTKNITFASSGIWSYIWRFLVIALVVYILLYIIGFFNGKCKSLPRGMFVTASLSMNGAAMDNFMAYAFNGTFWERNSWHIARFFLQALFFLPGRKFWYHQPEKPMPQAGVVAFKYSGDSEPTLTFRDEMYVFNYVPNSTPAGIMVDEYKNQLVSCKSKTKSMPDDIKVSAICQMFQKDPDIPLQPMKTPLNYMRYYGTLHPNGKLENIVFFVEHYDM